MKLIFKICFVICFSLVLSSTYSQSVKITNVSDTLFCSDANITVDYTTSGLDPVYVILQLSDNNGSFANPTQLSSSQNPTGKLKVNLSNYLVDTRSYSIRLISFDEKYKDVYPYKFKRYGQPTGNIKFTNLNFSGSSSQYFIKDTFLFESITDNANLVQWNFGKNALPQTSTNPSQKVVFTSGGINNVSLKIQLKDSSCGFYSLLNQTVNFFDCKPILPTSSVVVYSDSTFTQSIFPDGSNFWVLSNGTINSNLKNSTFYLEQTAKVNISSQNDILYLKGTSSLNLLTSINDLIIQEPGANLQIVNKIESRVCNCDKITFGYAEIDKKWLQYVTDVFETSFPDVYTMKVYPNPANEFVNLDLSESDKKGNIKIIDIYGEIVLSCESSQRLNISTLPNGSYFIEANIDNKILRANFTKVK